MATSSRKRGGPPIIDLDDYDESINMLIYGDSGIGKTVFGGSAEKTLILGTEQGTISAKRQGSKAKLWKILEWEDMEEAFTYLRDNPDHGYDWVVIDSGTEMQQKALRWILKMAVRDNGNRDPDIPAIQDHQKWQNMFKRFVGAFNDLPVNVLWTALAMRSEDEEGDDIILPLFLGKGYQISQWVCAQMHVVAYMDKKVKGRGEDREATRRLLFENIAPHFAKDRYGTLGRYMEDPTLPKVVAKINAPVRATPAPARTRARRPRPAATA